MCFARTFSFLEFLESFIFENMKYKQYTGGCYPISRVATTILQQRGYDAKHTLVATFCRTRNIWIPHFVVVLDDHFLVDLKRRCFQKTSEQVRASYQAVGFFPDGKAYDGNRLKTSGTQRQKWDVFANEARSKRTTWEPLIDKLVQQF